MRPVKQNVSGLGSLVLALAMLAAALLLLTAGDEPATAKDANAPAATGAAVETPETDIDR
jgi:hypothetical protein